MLKEYEQAFSRSVSQAAVRGQALQAEHASTAQQLRKLQVENS